jgi:hypothetical protein
MILRYIVFAGLVSTAAYAVAGTSPGAVQPAFAGAAFAGQNGPMASSMLIAGPGVWHAHTRRGDVGGHTTMLFSQRGSLLTPPSSAIVPPGSTLTPPVHADAAAPATVDVTAPPIDVPAIIDTVAETPAISIPTPSPADLPAINIGADVQLDVDAPPALAAVPEPATGMLLLAGLLGAGMLTRRRR